MLEISIPDNNRQEREYILNTLLSDFLGLNYHLSRSIDNLDYSISFDNKEVVIKDGFFHAYPKNLSYLCQDAVPQKIMYAKNEFTVENDIPVIYGSEELKLSSNKIICGIDIFASSFFLLTRWEEYVNEARDEHMRFPGSASLAYNQGFIHRPVVNEYVEMFWRMLKLLGYPGKRKERSFDLVLTHDIDQLDYPRMHRIIGGDILKRRNLRLAGKNLSHYLRSGSSPYDTFDFLMNVSERLGVKSHFYFMSSDLETHPDNHYYLEGKRFKEKLRVIKTRGHIIGFHPGYYTFNDMDRWTYEKQLLEDAVQDHIVEGRQHYLRFENPDTLRIWNSNNMEIDSTMGYAHYEGYRCGTGDIFGVFDFVERNPLKLKERPLVIMDGTLSKYAPDKAIEKIQAFIATSRRYSSTITLLFHNTTFYGEEWVGYDELYQKALNIY